MSKAALVVMAAGMGSRFGGGIKQLSPVGPSGELIIDYSIYDALRFGFDKVIFVIRKDIEDDFRSIIGRLVEKAVDVSYAYQETGDIPPAFKGRFAGRKKPWGTGQAVLCCEGLINEPFLVINSDDYYGREAYAKSYEYLRRLEASSSRASRAGNSRIIGDKARIDRVSSAHASRAKEFGLTEDVTKVNTIGEARDVLRSDVKGGLRIGMVGFKLENTLSDNGAVTRGLCRTEGGVLSDIVETYGIIKRGDGAAVCRESDGRERILDPSLTVSMNMWAFAPTFFDVLEEGFCDFLKKHESDYMTAEYLLPTLVGDLLKTGSAFVDVINSRDRWFGMTYKEDLPLVRDEIRKLINAGVYPEKLF